jgi:hypothetical protein
VPAWTTREGTPGCANVRYTDTVITKTEFKIHQSKGLVARIYRIVCSLVGRPRLRPVFSAGQPNQNKVYKTKTSSESLYVTHLGSRKPRTASSPPWPSQITTTNHKTDNRIRNGVKGVFSLRMSWNFRMATDIEATQGLLAQGYIKENLTPRTKTWRDMHKLFFRYFRLSIAKFDKL